MVSRARAIEGRTLPLPSEGAEAAGLSRAHRAAARIILEKEGARARFCAERVERPEQCKQGSQVAFSFSG